MTEKNKAGTNPFITPPPPDHWLNY